MGWRASLIRACQGLGDLLQKGMPELSFASLLANRRTITGQWVMVMKKEERD